MFPDKEVHMRTMKEFLRKNYRTEMQWLDEYDGNRVDIAAKCGWWVLILGAVVLFFSGIEILAMHNK